MLIALSLGFAESIKRHKAGDHQTIPNISIFISFITLSIIIIIIVIISLISTSYKALSNSKESVQLTEISNEIANNLDNNEIAGNWYDSTDKLTLKINATTKTMEVFTEDKKTLYIRGNYTVDKSSKNDSGYYTYIISVNALIQTIGGVNSSDSYITEFDVICKNNTLVMTNTTTNTIYTFNKLSN